MDEATDLSTVKQLGIVVHYLDMNTAAPVCKYLKLLEITSVHATAESVASVITGYLEDHAAPAPRLCNLAGASCDGASVMMGPENGVMARLKNKVPDLIFTHCSAHRLALATSDTARQFSWFKRFEKILCQVYTFFSRSAVHSAELREVQRVLHHPELHLKRPADTQWLSLEQAVDALRHCLQSVTAVLNAEAEEGDATTLGLASELAKPMFIITLYFLSDVLATLGALSLAFQKHDLNLLHVEQLISTHVATL